MGFTVLFSHRPIRENRSEDRSPASFRHVKIHEYQGKVLLARHGVVTPRGEAVFSAAEAGDAARRLGGRVVVKAQIHSGGRGKGGGVKLAETADDAERIAGEMLGMTLVTVQTGPGGRVVSRLLIEEGLEIASELYLGLLVDRAAQRLLIMASAAGGMEIEQVAAETPALIPQSAHRPRSRAGRVPGAASGGCRRSDRAGGPARRRR